MFSLSLFDNIDCDLDLAKLGPALFGRILPLKDPIDDDVDIPGVCGCPFSIGFLFCDLAQYGVTGLSVVGGTLT